MKTTRTCGAAALAAVLTGVPFAEAAPATLVASTGLRTLLPNHVAMVTLADVASRGDGEADVQLQLVDGRDRVLREVRGTVRRGQPLTVRLSRDLAGIPGDRLPLRAVARIRLTGDAGLDPAAPILTYETWNPTTIDDLVAETCQLEGKPDGGGGSPVGSCKGVCSCDFDEDDDDDPRP